eukprot:UN17802
MVNLICELRAASANTFSMCAVNLSEQETITTSDSLAQLEVC